MHWATNPGMGVRFSQEVPVLGCLQQRLYSHVGSIPTPRFLRRSLNGRATASRRTRKQHPVIQCKYVMNILNTSFVNPGRLDYTLTPLVEVGSDTLLVTIGDSWTFGGSMKYLLPDNATNDDVRQFRKENVFGAQLAKKLNADWLNVAIPAVSNRWMVDQFKILSCIRPDLRYTKVFVVLTLTEVGRELQYNECTELNLSAMTSVDMFVKELSKFTQKQIEDYVTADMTVIVGRNYIDDSYNSKLMLEKSWLDIIMEAGVDTQKFATESFILARPLGSIDDNFKNFSIPREQFLNEMADMFDAAQERIAALTRSRFNIHKQGYQHPNVEGHRLWADYVYQQIMLR